MSCWKEAAFLCVAVLVARVGADCVAGFQEVGHDQVQVIRPTEPKTWEEMQALCRIDFVGQNLVPLYANLTDELKKMCGKNLLPVNVLKERFSYLIVGWRLVAKHDWQLYDSQYPKIVEGFGALNLTSGLWHLVQRDFKFTCAMCQQEMAQLVFDALVYYEDNLIYSSETFQITLVSREIQNGPAVISADEQERLVKIIETTLDTPVSYKYNPTVSLRKIFIDSAKRLELLFHYNMVILRYKEPRDEDIILAARSANYSAPLQDYEMQVEYIRECPEEVTFGLDKRSILWPKARSGIIRKSLEESTGVYTRRECAYNETEYRHLWSPPTYWQIVWEPCSLLDQYANEVKFQIYLSDSLESKHNNVLQSFTNSPANESTLETIVQILCVDVGLGLELHSIIVRDFERISLTFPLSNGSDSFVLSTLLVQLVVANLEVDEPHNGVALAYKYSPLCNFQCPMKPVTVHLTTLRNSSEIQSSEKFAVQLSEEFTSVSSRLALVVVWRTVHRDTKIGEQLIDQRSRFPIIYIALALKDKHAGGLSLDNDPFYVEIAYEPSSQINNDKSNATPILVNCAAWNNALNNWTTSGCRQLKAERGNRTVCRCRGKYFQHDGSTLTAKYALLQDYGEIGHLLTKVFRDYTGPAVSMAIEVLLSGLGLLSIIFSAILFKKWRENPGHKILMHMVMALTCNLVLGFTTTFAQFDTESASCLIIGVFRHYSFLSMFLWMFVLSGLQLKRLTTVAGAKTTSHLILKVAMFAWGVPLLPIVVLLAWNTRFYRSDRFDRGYCYPEGLAFELTVQAPAGVILAVNFAVFIKILTHIFECRGEKVTKHSKNEHAQKLNRLKTSLFIFILFGFTWIFHFLSEERVIHSDFLFEYLFLMTATFHILMLALFFVVLQESTRELWLVYLGNMKSTIFIRKLVIRKNKSPTTNS